MSVRVVVTDHPWADLRLEAEALEEIGASLVPAGTGADLEALLEGADAVLNGFLPITAPLIDRMKACRIIARWGIGVDNIDMAAATGAGIQVTNVPDYCIEEVSTHVIALLLAANRRLFSLYDQSRSGGWGFASIRPVHRLQGQVLGVLGYGRIGRSVAAKAAALGLNVLCFDPYAPGDQAARKVDLETLLSGSDYISIHLPLTEQTRHLLNTERLALMKPEAFLINAARGEVLDVEALASALREGRLQGALLDVLPQEPPGPDHPLVGTGAVLTGHTAWYSEEALVELRVKAVRQVVLALSGKPVEYPVNHPPRAQTPGSQLAAGEAPAD